MSGAASQVIVPPERFGASVRARLRFAHPGPLAPIGNNLVGLWQVETKGGPGLEAVFEDAESVVRLVTALVPETVWPSANGVDVTRAEESRLRGRLASSEGWYAFGPAHAPSAVGAFRFPIGPVRGDVMESVGLTLTGMGDEVLGLRVDLGYKVRHVAHAATGRPVADAARVVGRATTTSTGAHALAFAQAAEAAMGRAASARTGALRSILAEIERVHSHLLDLASLAGSTGLPTAQQELLAAREQVLRAAGALTGHRYMRDVVVPGGLESDAPNEAWRRAVGQVVALEATVDRVFAQLGDTPSFLDRLNGAGIVLAQEAEAAGAVGPVGRASGSGPDTRRYRPYAGYADHPPAPVRREHTGDAWARWRVKTAEVSASLRWLDEAAARLPELDADREGQGPRAGWGLGRAEGPRGEIVYVVGVDEAAVTTRVSVRTASMRNWALMPAAVARRNVLQDVPIIDASFALSAAGSDM